MYEVLLPRARPGVTGPPAPRATGWHDEDVTATDRMPPGVTRVRAQNPSPLTLDGTNTYVAGGWVVDPGPADEAHLEAVARAAAGAEGIVLTHGHGDHADAAPELARRLGGVEVVRPSGDGEVGPFSTIATPGHSPDHVCLLLGTTLFSGDTVLGAGSVFVAPGEGSMSAYLDSLRRLMELEIGTICPGHGPVVDEPQAKLREYLEHRLEREQALLDALERGLRTHDELLDAAWSDVPAELRYPARITLEAHLEKLADEGRLPAGVGDEGG